MLLQIAVIFINLHGMSYPFLNQIQSILHTPIQKGDEVWIADTARVFGKVKLGHHCSVWFGAVLRGDADNIEIGNRSNVQENAVIHVDPGFPAIIGHDCIIGHGAIVHGATLGNHVLVGMHATILNGAHIGNYCIIGANALVTEGMQIPDFSIVMGSPAQIKKQVSDEHIEKIKRNAQAYVDLGKAYLKYWK
jgi:carbonic anhydrase/acetyltransferase-like protein (isoleucine patch superfamily)